MESKSAKNYYVYAKLNGKEFNIESDTLKDAFATIKDNISTLKTKIFLRIEGKEGVCSKVVMTQKGKQMFRNEKYIDIFIKHLIFKPNAL